MNCHFNNDLNPSLLAVKIFHLIFHPFHSSNIMNIMRLYFWKSPNLRILFRQSSVLCVKLLLLSSNSMLALVIKSLHYHHPICINLLQNKIKFFTRVLGLACSSSITLLLLFSMLLFAV